MKCPYDDSKINMNDCNDCFFYCDCFMGINWKENDVELIKTTDEFISNVDGMIKKYEK